MGKERIIPDQRRSAVVQATLRPKEREQLEMFAAAKGVTISNIVRKLILRDLRRQSASLAPAQPEATP